MYWTIFRFKFGQDLSKVQAGTSSLHTMADPEIRITQVTNVITLGYPGLSLNLRITGDVTFFQITQSGLRSWGYTWHAHMTVRPYGVTHSATVL